MSKEANVGGCFMILILALIITLVATSKGVWFSQVRYSLQYNIPMDSVAVQSEPSDCDFSRAPIGSKACHYEKEINVMPLGTETGTGRRIISFDNGKTRIYPDKDNPAVIVTWKKVEEP